MGLKKSLRHWRDSHVATRECSPRMRAVTLAESDRAEPEHELVETEGDKEESSAEECPEGGDLSQPDEDPRRSEQNLQ